MEVTRGGRPPSTPSLARGRRATAADGGCRPGCSAGASGGARAPPTPLTGPAARYMLNADNTVLRAASYADQPASRDTFFFATTNEPPHELSAVPVVAPDIAPPVGCIAVGRAEELLLLFTDAKWLESDSAGQKMPVEVRVRFESLGRIRA